MTAQTVEVELSVPAHEMAQEEIGKQVAFLSKDVRGVRFTEGGRRFTFEAPADVASSLGVKAKALADKVQRSLRSLERKIVYKSPTVDRPTFKGAEVSKGIDGVQGLGIGQVAMQGLPLKVFRYFDRVFEAFGDPWRAEEVMTPTLIPTKVLAKCDYFRSFPHNVTFASHLTEDAARIEQFRARHQKLDDLDDKALADMDTPEACLSPAVCYHVYHMNQDRMVPASGLSYGICGKCFRYESTNMSDLRRLWDFTMREVVFLGGREEVLKHRETSIGMMAKFLEEHEIAAEIRTASDPFFIAPDAQAKTYFQLSSETKYEMSILLPDDKRMAVGSHNYHSDFFGRAFNTTVEGAAHMHSVCVAFGLERWVYGFLAQHGADVTKWPAVMRHAPEFAGR